ncbi:tetratricopeptide (TPR) repeat protein [Actinoplanes octamycinicus]|uniref:Tetratricopeptide (TPR) repeat protein n=1 Tax=Actinoplanes octamycinicus TaxID=135948 RepID=A0A7W7H5Y2_9ACTN|nr:tetratricopeptide repeat protein [Actinoplanes octamycinicus]MBB4744262.1 tetratricopeptide (TPR) repeat protein [Actinoplanes octamycinicus]
MQIDLGDAGSAVGTARTSADGGRVVSVEVAGRRAAGCLIAGRLVLTSAGATPEAGSEVIVCLAASGRIFTGVVAWRGTPGGPDDAALVRIGDPAWADLPGPDPVLGRLVTNRPELPALAFGIQKSEWAVRVTPWPVAGLVREDRFIAAEPMAGARADRLVTGDAEPARAERLVTGDAEPARAERLVTGDAEPARAERLVTSDAESVRAERLVTGDEESVRGERLVGGAAGDVAELAGAPVFCGGLLVGVTGDGLAVTSVSALCRDRGFQEAAGPAVPRLSPVELAAAQLTEPDDPRSPASLLRAGARVVGFRGRHRLMDELGAWCSGAGFAALLLHGPVGQGKSRVAHELAGRLTAGGWATLWLDEAAPDEAVAAVADVVVPLLIVVDGAESRPEQLRALLAACARHDGARPLRVLLLARTAGDWWQLARSDRLLEGTAVVALPVLHDEPDGRAEAYRQAVHDLAAVLPRVPGHAAHHWPALAEKLSAAPYDAGGRALTVQMRALADLLDAAGFGAALTRHKPVEDRLLTHEQRYWSFTAAWHGLDLPEPVAQDVLAVAALVRPDSVEQADRLLAGVAGLPADRRAPVRAWLADLFPAGAGRPWGGLRPDRLAERFAGQRLAASPGLVTPLLPVLTDSQRRRVLTGWARAARHTDLTDRLTVPLTSLCLRHADLLAAATAEAATSVAAPGPLVTALRRIAADPASDVDRLVAIADRLPRLGDLAPLAVEITQRLTDLHRRAGRTAELAAALHNLSVRLGDLDRHPAALAAIEEAVVLHRRLAAEQPETYEAALARSLSSLAVRLGVLEQPEPALVAVAEATELYGRLTERDAGAYRADLAGALLNLSLAFGAVEQYPQALAAAEQAVALHRQLVEERPEAYLADLAAALSVLGISLGILDRNEPSRAVAEEAVALRRRLAEQRPEAFLPGLASALTDLAVRRIVLGEKDDALEAVEEALTIRYQLAEERPESVDAEGLEWSLHVHRVISGQEGE